MSMENLGPYSNFHELNQDWFLNEFNKLVAQWKEMQKNFDNLQDAFNDLKSYVQDYFKNLDVQDEINNKLDSMIADGTLLTIISPTIITTTGSWLSEHITNPSNPPLDTSFTISGAASDSKTVGDYAFLSNRININTPPFNLNECKPNRIYIISIADSENSPINDGGVCWSFANSSDDKNTYTQYFHGLNNKLYIRFNKYNTGWTKWSSINDNLDTFMTSNQNIQNGPFDLNDCVPNRIYIISINNAKNAPITNGGICWSFAINSDATNTYTQYFHSLDNNLYIRFNKYDTGWTDWENINNENYYNLSLFRRIGVIGDSYASGVVFSDNDTTVGDNYNISWLQQLSRKYGFVGINFSTGGLTTRSWLTNEHGLPLLNSTESCELILLCLGINDQYTLGESYLGVPSDIGTDNDTFYGNYSKIISSISTKNEKTRMILFTIANPNNSETVNKFNSAILYLSNHFGIPIEIQNENSYIKSSLYINNMVGGHPTAINYNGMSTAFDCMISESLKNNQNYFNHLFL